MTAANVSSKADIVQNLANVQTRVNSQASEAIQKCSFQSFMAKTTAGTDDLMQNVQSESKTASVKTDFTANDTSQKVATPKKESEADNDGIKEATEKACEEIKDAVKEELNLTEEELAMALSELGITVADLINPQNLAMLIADVNGVDVTAVITDDILTGQLKSLTGEINLILDLNSTEFNIPVENLIENIKNEPVITKEQPVAEAEQEISDELPKITVVNNEATGEQITITEHDSVTEEVVEVVKNPQETSENADTGTEDTAKGDKGNNNENLAGNLMTNLTESIESVMESSSVTTGAERINAADIVNQVIEAIRVNVSADTTSMELQLNPENLGKVNLTVASREGTLTATITVQNDAVKTAVESQLVQLKEQMNNQGLKVKDVEVLVAAEQFNFNDNSESKSDDNNGKKYGKRFRTADELPIEDNEVPEIVNRNIPDTEGSSVNYTA